MRCEVCGKETELFEVRSKYSDMTICTDCIDDFAFYCQVCETYYDNRYYESFTLMDTGEVVCEKCLRYFPICHICGSVFRYGEYLDARGVCINCQRR